MEENKINESEETYLNNLSTLNLFFYFYLFLFFYFYFFFLSHYSITKHSIRVCLVIYILKQFKKICIVVKNSFKFFF